ncbi:DNA polymerase III, delta subunit [Fontibacillus panacisegetis]|uniref:DNA polymerase III subunit delta n=1 Tax=Fontibacillus panacisegetis TaxID=670482 RepID=A0A1G7FXY2_9BACL|nr:DNA polymerase III subunit delta [Fontibacillus panacisegetis]SDE80729.1 DNA polymerase III, delta subunit [Fontibacillus panacisegetis]
MDIKSAIKDIKAGKVSPLYLCYGTEKHQIQEFVKLLQDQLVDRDQRDFAVATYDLTETPVEVVVEEAETLPFLVPRKLIIVRDSSLFMAGKEGGKLEHKIDALASYLNNPADHSVLLFLVNGEKLDERKKIVKAMKAAGTVLSFMPLGQNELVEWVIRGVEKRGCRMDREAAETLIAANGVQMTSLAVEVDKLCLYAGEGGLIDSAVVEQLVARSTEQNVFVMVEHIAGLKLDKALSIFYELLKQREEPIKIAALIARQFRIMLQVKDLARQSYSQQQIASQLGLHPYAVKVAGEQARKFEAAQLKAILNDLAQLDYKMKTGGIDKVLGLELFLLKLGA